MGWKDYFYFTRFEKLGINTLIILIMLIIFFPYAWYWLFPPEKYDFGKFKSHTSEHIKLYNEYLSALNTIKPNENQITVHQDEEMLNLQVFDPNRVSQQKWSQMGLPDHIYRNIKNYLNAGGSFRVRDDLKRIYTLNDSLYYKLEPYIDLPSLSEKAQKRTSTTRNHPANDENTDATQGISKENNVLVDINLADTVQWQSIRGIGPVFARRIVAYRTRLGGFYSINQLLEVFGMDTIRLNLIRPYIKIDDFSLKKIDINSIDFAGLVRHPYIDRNLASSILKIREMHGPYNTIEDIKKSHLVTNTIYQKIAPYLTTGQSK